MPGESRKILIAVQSEETQKEIKLVCDQLLVQSILSTDGSQATMILRNTPVNFVVVEAKFPSVSGVQIARNVRVTKGSEKAHILLIDNSDENSGLKARDPEINEVIPASITKVQLKEKITAMLSVSAETPQNKSSYDVRILNCFIEAAQEVFDFYFNKGSKIGKPFLKQNRKVSGYVSGLISLVAEKSSGSVSITSDRPFLELLAGRVFQGGTIKLDDAMIADLTGELCNQISGKVKINFAKIGMKFRIGLPKVVIGENHTVLHTTSNPVISLPIEIMGKTCSMEFCLAEGAGEQIGEDKVEAPPSDVMMF